MEKWYYYRLTRIWMMRNPFKGMALVVFIAFCAGGGVYSILDQYEWGKVTIDTLSMMVSFEATTTTLIASNKPFWYIIILVIVADSCNITLDLFVIRGLLSSKFLRSKIDWISRQGKRFWQKIKLLFTNIFPWVSGVSINNRAVNGIYGYLDVWRNHINGYKKNPTKAGYGAIFILSVAPRIPFLVFGGVSIAIFIIRYNKFDYRAWLVLILAITIRTSVWLAMMYGIISFF